MKKHQVTILCTDPGHPVNAWLYRWIECVTPIAEATLVRSISELEGGDFLFLVSCQQIVNLKYRSLFRHTLVLHASALPQGKGMSPHIWQILEGKACLTLTLLNAEDSLDSGDIWRQSEFEVPRTALYDEINQLLFDEEVRLMDWALANCDHKKPWRQEGRSTFYRRRTPADSAIKPSQTIAEVFDLLRVADPLRYPAYFEHRGQRYRLRLEKW